ncbi:DUF2946 family protein [Pseudoroseomonas cervicalis]|uniref:DUF2946 family protein n=1 Tax=Teichococcus cervicalis TaxID=204525 RepID=UPI0022F1D5C2|nr:DUF2946 family protein [Pseudoroseomonas cervicalis]WBV45181.1 hypothetical protein PFY06_19255 [Pseudoroseomonas cervicalis]
MRHARPLLGLLSLLLLLQWGAGLVPHLRAMAATSSDAIIICSPDGMRTLHLDAEGQPTDPDKAPGMGCCMLCPGPLALGAPQTGPVPAPVALWQRLLAARPLVADRLPPPRPDDAHPPRAPPIG